MDHEMLAIQQRMEGVLWEVLSRTNTTQAQFSNMMNYIMRTMRELKKGSYPRIALGKTRNNLMVIFEGHSFEVPRSGVGVAIIVDMLQHMEPKTTIGMRGEPTQWHVDQLVKEFKKKMPDKPKPEIEIDLKELGL